jgi:hypothetical protein
MIIYQPKLQYPETYKAKYTNHGKFRQTSIAMIVLIQNFLNTFR